MENIRAEIAAAKEEDESSSSLKSMFYCSQICLRVLATGAAVAAARSMFTCKQTSVVYGITVDARYSYSSAFKFFAFANAAAFGLSVLSLLVTFIMIGRRPRRRKNTSCCCYFYMFVHDLTVTILLMAGCGAATAIGLVGKYGNSHTGWMPICDHFVSFCNRVSLSLLFSYVCIIFYISLTITSACKENNSKRKPTCEYFWRHVPITCRAKRAGLLIHTQSHFISTHIYTHTH